MTSIQPPILRAWRASFGWAVACMLLLAVSRSLAEQPKPFCTFTAGSQLMCLEFSPDGRTLVSAVQREREGPSELKIWDVKTGTNTVNFLGHAGVILSVAFSPDGKMLASAGGRYANEAESRPKSDEGELRLWEVATGKTFANPTAGDGMVMSIVFSPDGTKLASANQIGTVDVWEVATGKKLATIATGGAISPFPGSHSLAFSPDGKKLAVGGGQFRRPDGGVTGQVQLWDLTTGERTAALNGHPGEGCFSNMFAFALSVAFSPDGKTVVSGGARTVGLWEVATGKNLMPIQGADALVVWRAIFGPGGRSIAVMNEVRRPGGGVKNPTQAEIRVVDVSSGEQLATYSGDGQLSLSAVLSPDGRTLASAGQGGTINVWDTAALWVQTSKDVTPKNDGSDSSPPATNGRNHARK